MGDKMSPMLRGVIDKGMSHSHSHDHDHHHGHHHAPADFGRAFLIGIALNTAFIGIEGLYGYLANSTALLADAGHNLSAVLGLATAWLAAVQSKRAPTARDTYGVRNTAILAARANAVLLLIASGAILLEAVQRLSEPEPVNPPRSSSWRRSAFSSSASPH